MTVSILGCGWYGLALAKTLYTDGFVVKGSTTSAEKLSQIESNGILPYQIKLDTGIEIIDPDFFKCDILVVCITPKTKSGEGKDYLPKLNRIIEITLQNNIEKVIYISSTGVYADINKEVNELTDPEPDSESGRLLLDGEQLFKKETDFKTAIIRFAGLVGPGRHPGRFFAGKKNIPNGQAPINLIHLDDCIGLTRAIIEKDAFGYVFNACSSDHPMKSDFYQHVAKQGGFALPEFIDELKNWKIVNSVFSAEVLDYQFKISKWADYDFN
ncbi:SDR family oxidoreductase [Mucilaginibacter sp. X4EP1]|uniref:SDR family oxidoreductase n=1 Tax=Mucilaginibacter sp. X4EP1 TaxID=2723092 RepID=UPI002168F23D|nr:SDR family oxidoreductase [Mucilaginibacter sp. X4EP1]MCS3815026.1 nucleoside-diphosphate-sugar epimerase [Mucilaginibacter sp. X4EP1]